MVIPRSDGDPESPEEMMWGIMRFNGSLDCDGGSEISGLPSEGNSEP